MHIFQETKKLICFEGNISHVHSTEINLFLTDAPLQVLDGSHERH